ncbi:hypothetical protein [Aquimarina sp. 2201CG14-23]|uniref:hypothetical protein n=1 Tax=Aquimarina mycalae TaxID=3040073 RepID=UPI002478272E|nr:hypothetical protein [Aquimarina sp. 2201CG14-23]MDH7447675.1 hypothetical protein [Aquimarina sp. 2201CG14-23]
MKTIYIYWMCLLLVVTSCIGDDGIGNEQIIFNPPEWTVGVWENEDGDALSKTLIFTQTNIILENRDGNVVDFSQSIALNGNDALIEEIATQDMYTLTILIHEPNASEDVFTRTFEKATSNSLYMFKGMEELGTFIKQ